MTVQPAIFQNFASDGEAFIRRGVETALVAFPTRYTHSPFEMVDERDLTAVRATLGRLRHIGVVPGKEVGRTWPGQEAMTLGCCRPSRRRC